VVLRVDRAHIEGDVLLLAQAEGIPDRRRNEDEVVDIGDNRDVVSVAEQSCSSSAPV
jgi:hypothetical protein